MRIDDKLISRLEQLSRLTLNAEEREASKKDLSNILQMVEKLHELDLEEVIPLQHISEQPNVLRKDVITHQVSREEALRNAPDRDEAYFRVPKVMNK